MTKDMTTGNPVKLLLWFSIPLLVGNIFQQFYNMADAAIVGRTLGYRALAAVGSTGCIMFLVFGFFFGLTSGLSVITAQRFGAKDYDNMRHSVAIAIVISFIFSSVTTIVCCLCTPFILRMMNTPNEIYQMTYDYMFVMFAGTFTLVGYGLISNIIRALGDSVTSVVFLIVSCLLNIGLDYWFILGLEQGCGGAAWATVISQGVSALLCLIYVIWKFPILKLQRKDWRWDFPFYKNMLRLSLPMALQFTVTAVGVVILQAVLNKFGPTYMAAVTTAAKLESIASMPLFSFGLAIATFAAQNYGANNYIRVRDGVRSCAWLVTAIAIVGMVVSMVFIRPFGCFFIKSHDKEILDAMQLYTNISSSQYVILALLLVYRNALQGLGHTFIPLMGGAAELVMRAFAALVLARFFGFVGVAWSHPLAWYGAFILLIIDYRRVIRKLLAS